jgi:hypothetical protein
MLRDVNLSRLRNEKNEHVEKWQARGRVEKFSLEMGFQNLQNGLMDDAQNNMMSWIFIVYKSAPHLWNLRS